jgi:hypothetical protein
LLACRSSCIVGLFRALCLALLLSVTLAGCGYHVGGKPVGVPAGWKTVAVPIFVNKTAKYRIEQRLTEGVIHELLQRTSWRVIQNPDAADGILTGEVTRIESAPLLFNQSSGQVTTLVITVYVKVTLTDRVTKKVVFHADKIVLRNEYQISSDPKAFFEEENPALNRLSRDFGSRVVAAILESF